MQNPGPRILAVETAVPPQRFTQQEVLQLAGYTSPAARRIFPNSDIDYRHLFIRPSDKVPQVGEPAARRAQNPYYSKQDEVFGVFLSTIYVAHVFRRLNRVWSFGIEEPMESL